MCTLGEQLQLDQRLHAVKSRYHPAPMGYRYYLCRSVRMSKAAFERAQSTPFMKLFFVDDDGNCELKEVHADQLFGDDSAQAINEYDEKAQRWTFGCAMHDDDWDNGDEAPLPKALKKLKDLPGTDLVLVATDWEDKIEKAWTVAPGKVTVLKKAPKLAGAASKQIFTGKYGKAIAALSKELGL